MGVSVIGKSSGGSGSQDRRYLCTNNMARGRTTYSSSSVFTTLLNVSGKGYVSRAMCGGNGGNVFFKITIDGVVKVYVCCSTGMFGGLFNYNDFLNTDSATASIYALTPSTATVDTYAFNRVGFDTVPLVMKPYPYVAGIAGVCLTNIDIYFESSLLIESAVENVASATSYHIEYGVI